MKRREFLINTAVAVAGLSSPRTSRAQGANPVKPATLDRIAIMSLNFQNMLKVPDTQPGPARTLELFDLGQMIADTYGVHKVEFQHYHLASTEPSYLKDLRAALAKSKSRATQINLEFSGLNISAPMQRDRLLAIDLTKQFVDHAVLLGAQRVMINQGAPTQENKAAGIAALKTMADYGRSKGIIVSVETRGTSGGGGGNRAAAPAPAAGAAPGAASPAPAPAAAPPPPTSGREAWMLLAEIIKAAGAYSNVDVGGARALNQAELHECLRTMFPFTAGTMHTRVNAAWDLPTAIKFLEHDLGYKGLYTIESSSAHAGTKEIYDVVVSTL